MLVFMYSKVVQSYLLLFICFSTVAYHRILMLVPCAGQEGLLYLHSAVSDPPVNPFLFLGLYFWPLPSRPLPRHPTSLICVCMTELNSKFI